MTEGLFGPNMVEMKIWERTFASALVLVLALAACNKAQKGPSLSDTLSWMSHTYNPGSDGFGGHGLTSSKCSANCKDVGTEISFRETFAYNSCQISTTTISSRKSDHGLHETFSLGDIDPQSIRVLNEPQMIGEDGVQVKFSARNDIEALTYSGNIVGKSDNSEWSMDDAAYARQFAEAFRHAVELCGGKASAFPLGSAGEREGAPPPDVSLKPMPSSGAPTPESAEGIFQRLSPSVFVIEALDKRGSVVATGSGVMVGPGQVVTNKHVIEQGTAWTISHGREVWPASVARVDVAHDLCELKVPILGALPVAMRASSSLVVGERVYAIGAPEGLELTLSEGVVSGLRDFGGGRVIQTSAPISPGSSGGGLFDAQGQLIGITTFSMKEGQNLNFALPTEWVEALVRR